jgi:hypothetical protein
MRGTVMHIVSFVFGCYGLWCLVLRHRWAQQRDAQARAIQSRDVMIVAHRVEHAGTYWGLWDLHTGTAMPLEAGDILYLAAPPSIPETVEDETCFEEQP